MSKARITVRFIVSSGYQSGDYARLCSNGGSGEVDYENPVTNEIYELFPNGAGIYGWGFAPWGNHPWGCAYSMGCNGWGYLPWGYCPWGYGTAVIEAEYDVTRCGDYKFAFACYDKLGNLHEGTPDEVTVYVHLAPDAPTRLTKESYNKTTDVLVLNAA